MEEKAFLGKRNEFIFILRYKPSLLPGKVIADAIGCFMSSAPSVHFNTLKEGLQKLRYMSKAFSAALKIYKKNEVYIPVDTVDETRGR